MMRVARRQLNEAALIGPTDRQTARLEAARTLSRRQQALLAAAGEDAQENRWYVLRVKPKAEKAVDNALGEAGVARWLPMVLCEPKDRPERGDAPPPGKFKLAWPGYLFVKVPNTPRCWAGLATVEGVFAVLGTALRPAPVTDENVCRYKLFLEKDEAARKTLLDEISVGEMVRVKDGPFASFTGIVDRIDYSSKSARLWVEVFIFGRTVPVELDLAQVAKGA